LACVYDRRPPTTCEMLHETMEYRFSITDVLSSKVVIGRWPYAHGPILRHVIVCAPHNAENLRIGKRIAAFDKDENANGYESQAAISDSLGRGLRPTFCGKPHRSHGYDGIPGRSGRRVCGGCGL
jgi:hypothetical protein